MLAVQEAVWISVCLKQVLALFPILTGWIVSQDVKYRIILTPTETKDIKHTKTKDIWT